LSRLFFWCHKNFFKLVFAFLLSFFSFTENKMMMMIFDDDTEKNLSKERKTRVNNSKDEIKLKLGHKKFLWKAFLYNEHHCKITIKRQVREWESSLAMNIFFYSFLFFFWMYFQSPIKSQPKSNSVLNFVSVSVHQILSLLQYKVFHF
jgi:hypothetical protein